MGRLALAFAYADPRFGHELARAILGARLSLTSGTGPLSARGPARRRRRTSDGLLRRGRDERPSGARLMSSNPPPSSASTRRRLTSDLATAGMGDGLLGQAPSASAEPGGVAMVTLRGADRHPAHSVVYQGSSSASMTKQRGRRGEPREQAPVASIGPVTVSSVAPRDNWPPRTARDIPPSARLAGGTTIAVISPGSGQMGFRAAGRGLTAV